jgi:hypothetical protein
MVVSVGIRDAEVKLYAIDERELRQRQSSFPKILGRLEKETPSPDNHRASAQERASLIPTIAIEPELLDRVNLAVFVHFLECHVHPGGGTTVRCI